MNFDLETFHKFDFTGSQITTHNIFTGQSETYFILEGSFEDEQYERCKFWSLWFKLFEKPSDVNTTDFTGNKIRIFDICPEGELFLVKIIVETDNEEKEIAFRCREVMPNYYRYRGMSYRNLYDTEDYRKTIDRKRYVLDKQYFMRKEEVALPDGYSIETALYQDATQYSVNACLQKCILKKSDKTVYEYLCTYYHGARFKDFILHSNGRRYLPFHVDLYGISYLDIDSLEVYHYVPEGYEIDFKQWQDDKLVVTVGGEEKKISVEEIIKAIK